MLLLFKPGNSFLHLSLLWVWNDIELATSLLCKVSDAFFSELCLWELSRSYRRQTACHQPLHYHPLRLTTSYLTSGSYSQTWALSLINHKSTNNIRASHVAKRVSPNGKNEVESEIGSRCIHFFHFLFSLCDGTHRYVASQSHFVSFCSMPIIGQSE